MITLPVTILYYLYKYFSMGIIYKLVQVYLCIFILDQVALVRYNKSIMKGMSFSQHSPARGDDMADTQGNSQTRAKNKYNAKAYDNLRIVVKKGRKDIIKAHAEAQGESLNGFVNRAIDEAIERDSKSQSEITGRPAEWQVIAVEPHEDYTMTVTFRYGEKKLYDMRPLIDGDKAFKPYAPLKDITFFMQAYVDDSVAWSDEIDIAPEELYDNGKPLEDNAS